MSQLSHTVSQLTFTNRVSLTHIITIFETAGNVTFRHIITLKLSMRLAKRLKLMLCKIQLCRRKNIGTTRCYVKNESTMPTFLLKSVNFKVYCRPHSESLSSLAPNSSNYREAIRAFPNHTAGFPTRLIAL